MKRKNWFKLMIVEVAGDPTDLEHKCQPKFNPNLSLINIKFGCQ